MAEPYAIKHVDEMETTSGSGGATWRLARRSLGLEAFGMNIVEIPAGSSILEHDEVESDQVEVFTILEGEATMLIDGQEFPAPAGTYTRVQPAVRRNVLNRSDAPVSVLITSAPRSSGYQPMAWA